MNQYVSKAGHTDSNEYCVLGINGHLKFIQMKWFIYLNNYKGCFQMSYPLHNLDL